MKKRVVVLLSGSGSNLQALLDWTQAQPSRYEITSVLSNQAEAYGLVRAEQAGIPTQVIDHTCFPTREAFDEKLVESIGHWQPDIVVLAGFMRILTPVFTDHYLGKAVNIHPSLLPKYRGLHTHRRALEAGDKEHGLSIHYVTSELDGGPVILQEKITIQPEDTEASLKEKVHAKEHLCYPRVVEAIAREEITFCPPRACLHQAPLTTPLNLEQLNALLAAHS